MTTHRDVMDAQPLLADGTVATGNATYDALPRGVKDLYTLEQWLWLGDTEKGSLIQSETEPEA